MRCRAHKLQHERAGPSRRGASNTSTRIAPISCDNRCSHVPRVDPARQPRPDCPSESCFEALRSTSCGRAASLWIEPWMDSMSAAIFSALSIFSTTSSTSRPGWRMPKKRRHSHQRDDRDSAETSPRASNRHFPSWRAQGPSVRFCPGAFYTVAARQPAAQRSQIAHTSRLLAGDALLSAPEARAKACGARTGAPHTTRKHCRSRTRAVHRGSKSL